MAPSSCMQSSLRHLHNISVPFSVAISSLLKWVIILQMVISFRRFKVSSALSSAQMCIIIPLRTLSSSLKFHGLQKRNRTKPSKGNQSVHIILGLRFCCISTIPSNFPMNQVTIRCKSGFFSKLTCKFLMWSF